MTPARREEIRQLASEWEFDKRIPAHRAAGLLRELLRRVDELERDVGKCGYLSGFRCRLKAPQKKGGINEP